MKQGIGAGLMVVCLLVGMVGGYGLGYLMYEPRISSYETQVSMLTSEVSRLRSTVSTLEAEIAGLEVDVYILKHLILNSSRTQLSTLAAAFFDRTGDDASPIFQYTIYRDNTCECAFIENP